MTAASIAQSRIKGPKLASPLPIPALARQLIEEVSPQNPGGFTFDPIRGELPLFLEISTLCLSRVMRPLSMVPFRG